MKEYLKSRELGRSQRMTVEDVEREVRLIQEAIDDGDYEAAASVERQLAWNVVQKLANRGSRIAKAALAAKELKYPRSG